ncbi:hypothetical protein AAZX31_20G162700 [Glycine max]|uniref:Uncharacterized protein n=1 Tax=Glycine max TaxID=3847 RepID=K7N437_SOYBN|nr:gibberellin-regulated protein 2 [Glycine max]XP_028220038.1 gibberellin-regulated protein 2-like [Glycine soja]XP_028220039.1 gibberellin-regulated protein 2-like [Glycine soja]XP_028220040.1 gibberellin-regulated protein 2-like [Glycine soja]KAH1036625.1 hypothetical protein GYH30_056191 [Glycine max]KHN00801.1 Gibberellin-regulated protein 3 [Glycine soja]KRG91811.1 hypothetical protein GLYMA_20G175800v4 [Glycine max]|eukprot:XP_006606218.1 gibberellin-regulated protein 2 [Glycine max]
MAITRSTVVLAILCFILIRAELGIYGEDLHMDAAKNIDCGGKCNYRCSKTSRHKMCIRACNSCCKTCSCVPPGTSGNRDMCPCYASLTTHGGKLKCP